LGHPPVVQLLHATNPDLLNEVRHPLDLVLRVEGFSGDGVPIRDGDVTFARPSPQRVQRSAAFAGRLTCRDEGVRCANRFFGHFFAHTSYHLSDHFGILPEIHHLVRQQPSVELTRWRRELTTNPPPAWKRQRVVYAAALLGVVADHDPEGLGAVLDALRRERPELANALVWHLAAPTPIVIGPDGRSRIEGTGRFRKLIALSPTYPPLAVLIQDGSIARVSIGPMHTQEQIESVLRSLPRPSRPPGLKATVVRGVVWGIVADFRWGADVNPRFLVREAWKEISLAQELLREDIGVFRIGKRRRRAVGPVTEWVVRHLCGETYRQIAGRDRSWQAIQRAVLRFWRVHGISRGPGSDSYVGLRKNVRAITAGRDSASPG